MNSKISVARTLRKNLTPQERKLWNLLSNHRFYGLEFRRQYPMGKYIVDFICRETKLIIELDGGQHNETENVIYDGLRTQYFESLGYKVVRFWNCDVDSNIEGVLQTLKTLCNK